MFVRRALFATLFTLSALVLSVSICAAFWLPSIVSVHMSRAWGWSVLAICRLFGIRYKVEGELPKSLSRGGFIIASKHQSPWEIAALHYLFFPAVFMFKRELLYIPLAGFAMLKEGSMPVDRGSTTRVGLLKLIGKFKEKLKTRNVAVFPEGTRTLPGAAPAYKSGIGTIAAGLGSAAIIPVAHNSGRIWPRRGYPSFGGLITLRVMPVINTKGLGRNEINKRLEAAVEKGMRGL